MVATKQQGDQLSCQPEEEEESVQTMPEIDGLQRQR